jgi:tellurite resistance protein TerC
MIWLWTATIFVLLLLLALDLLVLNRAARRLTPLESVGWTFFWLALAGAANGAVWLLHHNNALGIADATGLPADEASFQFLAAFLCELGIGLDSVLVMTAVFAHRRTNPRHLHRILFAGLVVAIAGRGLLIGGIARAMDAAEWVRVVLAVILVLAGIRMLILRRENTDPQKNPFVRLIRRIMHVAEEHPGDELVALVGGRISLTPLVVTVLLVETADIVFAADSIPAAFAMTSSPFLVFVSNCFALLCLRSLFLALRDIVGWIRFVKIPLAMVLGYAAVVISLPDDQRPHTWISVTVVASALVAGFGAAMIFVRPGQLPQISALGEDADRLARLTLKQARKLIVLIVGLTVVGLGILMMIGPGPGLLVVPIGLALLASEFVWAKRLLSQYTQRATAAGKKAGDALAKRSHPWLIPPVVLGSVAGLWAIVHFGPFPASYVLPGAVPFFLGQAVWAVLTIRRHRARKQSPAPATPPIPNPAPTRRDVTAA